MNTAASPTATSDPIAPSARLAFFLNWGHTLDHLFMLIFPTAAIALALEWKMSYAELLKISIGGWIAFGLFSIPAGWLADKWSRWGTMVLFFIGIGSASILTGLAQTTTQVAIGLTLIGMFAAIYHPVGIAMLTIGAKQLGRTLGVNGVWGNCGLAVAALLTGALVDLTNWRWAFIVPGIIAIATGIVFALTTSMPPAAPMNKKTGPQGLPRSFIIHVFVVVAIGSALGSIIFNATTISMPKVFHENLSVFTQSSLGIGMLVAVTYVIAAIAQLIVGSIIDKHGVRMAFIAVVAMQVPLLFLAGVFSGLALFFIAIGMMFFVFGQIPINDAMIARYTADEWRARAYALRYVLSFTAGTLAVNLIAYSHARSGFPLLFTLLAGGAAIIFVAALTFPKEPRAA
jgi:MFS family permease